MLKRSGGRGGFGMTRMPAGGGPGGGLIAALVAVGVAGVALSNSFFNGMVAFGDRFWLVELLGLVFG